jgi:hypothetical protein
LALLFLGILFAAADSSSAAPPTAPAPPKEYKVHVRYRIHAQGNARLTQFFSMVRYLEQLGFQKDPGQENEPEDPEQTLLTGAMAAAGVPKLLTERHVLALLLIPADYALPTEGDQLVKVQLQLKSGLPLERQRLLADQTRELLAGIGFQEAVGYDNRGHTRLVGLIARANLDQLLEDLRWQGNGWLTPAVPVALLPLPIRSMWPVLTAEVLPEPNGIPPAKQIAAMPTPNPQDDLVKIAPELRGLLKQTEPRAVELLYVTAPPGYDTAWQRALLRSAAGLEIQGQLGQWVTVKVPPDQVAALARLPYIRSLRVPRAAAVQPVSTAGQVDLQAALTASGVARLHQQGRRGKGVRVAVIDGDFRGYRGLVGGPLPATTQLVDMTAEGEADIQPRGAAEGGPALGHGTQIALALAAAAPDVDLTLVRIDPEAPYQFLAVAQYINGDPVQSLSLENRRAELVAAAASIESRRGQMLEERKKVLENFGQDKASEELRQAFFKKEAELDKEDQELERRQTRFLNLNRALLNLKCIRIVACGLLWDDAFAVDGGSVLSRYFDGRQFGAALWFQAAGNTHGQSWAGLFRDVDGNGVMEFAGPEVPLPAQHWTRELNFLAWQPLSGPARVDLPKTRLRVAVQWREPHDPTFSGSNVDAYRVPLANLRLVVLRQRDPSGTQLPADDLEVVAQSAGLPQRLDVSPNSAMYEQVVEFDVDPPGRYALRLEGRVPNSIRPVQEPLLPSMQVNWELRPRLFLNVVNAAMREQGTVVFQDFQSEQGSIGVPADARQVLSVGTADLSGKPERFSSRGSVLEQQLRRKPDLLSFAVHAGPLAEGNVGLGSGLAAGFAAGAAALQMSGDLAAAELQRRLRLRAP